MSLRALIVTVTALSLLQAGCASTFPGGPRHGVSAGAAIGSSATPPRP